MELEVEFTESAFRHGYEPRDFLEMLSHKRLLFRSQQGLEKVFEVYGRNDAGDYLHVVYRKTPIGMRVFHMRRMTDAERARYWRRI